MSRKINQSDPEETFADKDVPSSGIYTYQGKVSKLQKPPCRQEPGKVYMWARKDIRGIDDHRIEDLESEGWEVVEKEKSTSSKILGDPLGRNPLSSRFYTYKDTILMKIDGKYINAYHRQLSKENRQKIKSIEASITDDSPFAYGFCEKDKDDD